MCLRLDQLEPPLDAFDPAIRVFEAQLGCRVIDFHCRQIAFCPAEPQNDFAKTRLDKVQPLVNASEIGTKNVENLGLLSQANPRENWGE